MTASNSKMMVLVEPPTAYIRCVGRAAVERAGDFRSLVQRLDQKGIRRFCLDLTECKLMDSTFSGILASLASEFGKNDTDGCHRFVLVNPNERVRDLLDNLGVLPLVSVLDSAEHPGVGETAEEVAKCLETREATLQHCLDAHHFLMALDPKNAPKFRDLTRALEAEKAAAKIPPAPGA